MPRSLPTFHLLQCTIPCTCLMTGLTDTQASTQWDMTQVRDQRLSRMKSMGIVPDSTVLGPWLEMVPRWADLSAEQQSLRSPQDGTLCGYGR